VIEIGLQLVYIVFSFKFLLIHKERGMLLITKYVFVTCDCVSSNNLLSIVVLVKNLMFTNELNFRRAELLKCDWVRYHFIFVKLVNVFCCANVQNELHISAYYF